MLFLKEMVNISGGYGKANVIFAVASSKVVLHARNIMTYNCTLCLIVA